MNSFEVEEGGSVAREFARRFYKSKEWLKCREAVFKRDFGLCVRCGEPGAEVHHKEWLRPENINNPNITLNHDNLETLCKECHHKAHERNQFTKHDEVAEGLMFDEHGNLVEQ